jgi:hypothetical protein
MIMNLLKSDIFKFNNLYPLLGLGTPDKRVKKFMNTIHSKFESDFIIREPLPDDIESVRDKWQSYECEKLGLIIEVVDGVVAVLSFRSGVSTFEGREPVPAYPCELLDGLSVTSTKQQIREQCGDPVKSESWYDQFELDDRVRMSALYNESSRQVSVISYGYKPIFIDETKRPNRISMIFESLS